MVCHCASRRLIQGGGLFVCPATLYGNRVNTVFAYDAANRLTKIDHRDPLDAPILSDSYTYCDNNLELQTIEFARGFPRYG